MSRGTQTFKQGDVTKALKAAAAAGVGVRRIEIDPRDGKIVIVAGQPEADSSSAGDANEWDTVK
jgi:hypothetical protein